NPERGHGLEDIKYAAVLYGVEDSRPAPAEPFPSEFGGGLIPPVPPVYPRHPGYRVMGALEPVEEVLVLPLEELLVKPAQLHQDLSAVDPRVEGFDFSLVQQSVLDLVLYVYGLSRER